SSIGDAVHPIEARLLGRRVSKLQEMFDDAADLAADCVALALAQIFDLLGDVLAIEPVVRDRHGSQDLGLVLRPGVEIILVARSVRHRGSLLQPDVMAWAAPIGDTRGGAL